MATTITAPSSHSPLPRWLMFGVAALAAVALIVGLAMSLGSGSSEPATVTPQTTQVVGSPDAIDHAATSDQGTQRSDVIQDRTGERGEKHVPGRAF